MGKKAKYMYIFASIVLLVSLILFSQVFLVAQEEAQEVTDKDFQNKMVVGDNKPFKKFEGLDVNIQMKEGVYEISSIEGKSSAVKITWIDFQETYDLSDGGSLKIDSDGKILKGSEFKVGKEKETYYLDREYPVANSKKYIRGISEGTTVEILEEGVKLTDSEGKEIFNLDGSKDGDFRVVYKGDKIEQFSFFAGENGATLDFNGGKLFFEEGSDIDFTEFVRLTSDKDVNIIDGQPKNLFIFGTGTIAGGVILGEDRQMVYKKIRFDENGNIRTSRGHGMALGLEKPGDILTIDSHMVTEGKPLPRIYFGELPTDPGESYVVIGEDKSIIKGYRENRFLPGKNFPSMENYFDPERHALEFRGTGEIAIHKGHPPLFEIVEEGMTGINDGSTFKISYNEEIGKTIFTFGRRKASLPMQGLAEDPIRLEGKDVVSLAVVGEIEGRKVLAMYTDKEATEDKFNKVVLSAEDPWKDLVVSPDEAPFSNYVREEGVKAIPENLQIDIFDKKVNPNVLYNEIEGGIKEMDLFKQTLDTTNGLKEVTEAIKPLREELYSPFAELIVEKSSNHPDPEKRISIEESSELTNKLSKVEDNNDFEKIVQSYEKKDPEKYKYLRDYIIRPEEATELGIEKYYNDITKKEIGVELLLLEMLKNGEINEREYQEFNNYGDEEFQSFEQKAKLLGKNPYDYLEEELKQGRATPNKGLEWIFNPGEREKILEKQEKNSFIIEKILFGK